MFEDKTPESIKAEIIAGLQTDISTREGSYTDTLIGPMALSQWKVYQGMNAAVPMFYVDENSGEYIDRACKRYGIYRKPGTKAKVTLQFSGTDGAQVPAGSVFLTLAGQEFLTLAAAAISGGAATAPAEAEDVGAAYNVAAGTIINQYSSISGIVGVTNPAATAGGADPESDASLFARYEAHLQKPVTGGNVHHYEQMALETPGVGAVKVTPLENGPGTVGVLIAGPEKQPVDSEIVAACAAHIEGYRLIGPTVTVASAEGLPINVTVTVILATGATEAQVREDLTAELDAHLKSIAFVKYELLYNQVVYILMGLDGVENFSDLQINGAAESVTIAANQVPVLGTVEVSA